MKNRIISFCILSSIATTMTAQNRDILWLPGVSATSYHWSSAQLSAQGNQYDFNIVNITPYDNNDIANNIPDWATFFNTKLNDGNHTDVLGIGHDAGGLIIRYMDMAQQNGRLSAMILDGTPNQGAGVFNHLIPTTSGVPSGAQKMIDRMLNLRTQAQDCTGCQSMEAIQGWINLFANEGIKNYYQQLKPSNSVITNLETPGIPYAVIWGNEDHEDALTLTRLVTSWESSAVDADDEAYIDCFNSIIEQRIQGANQQFALGLMQSIAQLAGAAGKVFTTSPNPGAAVEATINAAVTALRSMFNLQKEIREVAECELVHQAMNAQWNLMLAPYETHTGYLDVPCLPCEQCESEEDPQVAGWCWSNCMYGCDPITQSFQEPYTFITFQPHDGLLLKTEQLLAGAAKTYEAKGVNHMQEQFWEYAPIGNAFQDLFNGGAGAAFIVPK